MRSCILSLRTLLEEVWELLELLQPQFPDFDFAEVVEILFSTDEAIRACVGGVIEAAW